MIPLRLYLLRHAASSRAKPGHEDFDRPLADAGRVEMEQLANLMVRNAWLPERVVCSAARRARQTLEPLLQHFPEELDIRLTRRIYNADAGALLAEIRMSGGDARSLLLVGHNPAMEELARLLVADGDTDATVRLAAGFPTAALAVIDIPSSGWNEIRPRQGRLAAFATPGKS